jgi:hypothetical protein
MGSGIIVWDIETVPDLQGFAAAKGLINQGEEEVRAAIGEKFPKHVFHSIVCIGALIAHPEPEGWQIDALGAPHCGERSEKELMFDFAEYGPAADVFRSSLSLAGYVINHFELQRSSSLQCEFGRSY